MICIVPVSSSFAIETGKTYYVSPSGNNKNPGTEEQPVKTLVSACRLLKPGDSLVLRAGLYKEDPITSYGASGTREKSVSIKAYKGETPVIDGGKYGKIFNLSDKDYYSVEGITFTNGGASLAGCSHITVRNCIFKGASFNIASSMKADSSYVTFESNILTDTGDYSTDGEGDGMYLTKTSHCLIQNNYFANCGHYVINDYGKMDVIRNNIMEQRWGGGISLGEHILVEGNRVYYVNDHVNYPKASVMCCGDNNILRNNVFANGSDGPYPGGGFEVGGFANGMHAIGNRIYNNIIYKTGSAPIDFNMKFNTVVTDNWLFNNVIYYGNTSANWAEGLASTGPSITYSAYFSSKETFWGKNFPNKNPVFNNIMLNADGNGDHPGFKGYIEYITGETAKSYYFKKSVKEVEKAYPKYYYKNLEKAPQFVNPDTVDIYKDDFRLSKGSPAIDAGSHFARTVSAGAKIKIVKADDVNCFFDGYGITAGDALKIGSNPVVRIEKIDYTAKTITVSAPVTYKKGDFIDLPYSGTAPDIGAYEYNPPAIPPSGTANQTTIPARPVTEVKKAYQTDIDDWFDIGRDVNKIDYYGPWAAYIPGTSQYSAVDQDGAYKQTLHKSSNYGYYEVKFQGTGVKVFAPTGPAFGIAEVSVDSGNSVDIDYYSEERIDQAVFEKSGLAADKIHILKVRVTGRKNSASVDLTIPCDRVSIIDAAQTAAGIQ